VVSYTAPALILEADAREARRYAAALELVGVPSRCFRTFGGLVEAATREALRSHARLIIVDYDLLPEPRLEMLFELTRSAPGVPTLLVLPWASPDLALHGGRAGATSVRWRPVNALSLEEALYPNRVRPTQLRRPTLEESVREIMHLALARNGGNVVRTAAELGIDRRTLQRKVPRERR
jgi:ActR/RegA family two-component response regulator